jgi:hypothetical protein
LCLGTPFAAFVITRWAGHRTVLCPVVFLGMADEAERVAEGCPKGVVETGEGVE